MGMTEREELILEIATLEARRTVLIAAEGRRHADFIAEDDDAKADQIATDLQDICGEFDELGAELGIAKAKLDLIEARISRREFLEDHPVGGRML
jgi:hypothetical protein